MMETARGLPVWLMAVLFTLTVFTASASAQESAAKDPALLALGIGWYDFRNSRDEAADFRLEYRHGPAFLEVFKPFAGVEVTSDGSLWAGGGLALDLVLADRLAFTLSSGPGYFAEGGGKDLGSHLEFRSQAEIAYVFEDRARLALAISHLSNAGVGDRNPGVEVLSLYYMVPLGRLGY